MALVALWLWPTTFSGIAPSAWIGLGYVSLFSMLIGFVFWYRGLALGGTTKVGQLQLLQPLAGFALSALLLGEAIGWPTLLTALVVLPCVVGARQYA
jgi:drug/metabolite transporter (DMT)-like permease